jgi:hypothetical protein
MLRMRQIWQGLQKHPYWTALGALVGGTLTVSGIWSLVDDRPMLLVLWGARPAVRAGHFWALAVLILMLLSVTTVVALAVAAAQGMKREKALRSKITALETTLDSGDFSIVAPDKIMLPRPQVGAIYWKGGQLKPFGRLCTPRELAEENWAFQIKFEKSVSERQRLIDERDSAIAALRDKKQEYAMGVLERFSNLRFRDDVKPTVTVRYCSYGQD